MKNLLLAQSGGPTAAINATVAGAFQQGMISSKVGKVYGSVNGIKGAMEDRFIDLTEVLSSPHNLALLETSPAAALGSCRVKLKNFTEDESQYIQIFNTFKKYDIGYFVYIGGNDSMDTVQKLSAYAKSKGIDDIKIMGAPKTVDNDICETDHTPGFASAAKYIGTTLSEIQRDCNVYDVPAVTLVEIMGRNAGWLTASAVLARKTGCGGPALIYLPEVAFDCDAFIEDIKQKLSEHPAVVVALSEGIKDAQGRYVGESAQSGAVDAFGHKYLAGAAKYLESLVKEKVGCKVRSVELNLMQRCAAHLASASDIYESKLLGAAAVERAVSGMGGEIPIIVRTSNNPYAIRIETRKIELVANKEKLIPREWINDRGNDVTKEMMDYLLPLIEGETTVLFRDGLPQSISLY